MPTLFDSGYGPRPRYQDAAVGALNLAYGAPGATPEHPIPNANQAVAAFNAYYGGPWNPTSAPASPSSGAATIGSWPPAMGTAMPVPGTGGGGAGGIPREPTIDPTTGLFVGGGGNQSPTLGPTPWGGGPLSPSIAGLLQQGLIPDVARQSAEVAGGRGVGGSPAGASTAVRMSEQDYLQRLGLANTLMTGEASRALPYQITPYQSAQMQLARDIALFRAQAPLVTGLPRYGSRSGSGYGGGYGGGGSSLGGGGGGIPGFNWGGGSGFSGGGGGGGGQSLTLDDIYDQLGFGNFGSQPGDTIGGGYDGSIPGFDYYE